jgi:aconitate hydratase
MAFPDVRQAFSHGSLYSLPALEKAGIGAVSRLPVSLRIVLESLLRNLDGKRVREEDIRNLCAWKPRAERTEEVPFVVARVLLQDFTGVPLIVDLAAMRSAVSRLGREPKRIEPSVPVDLVIDHSVQVDHFGTPDAYTRNLDMEFVRNRARYEFLKWGAQAFNGLRIVPPGFGICHQVNLEYLARGVVEKNGVSFPDTLVGTDSHTTMINGLGIVGWGVGGIEAEAAMLNQPVYFLMPDVVGVHLSGALREGATATDAVLHVTERLRKANVVGKFVEFHGEGAAALPVPERATIANMAPEYGATMGYFPIDEATCRYLETTGRSPAAFRAYFQAQGMFGMPKASECEYTELIEVDLSKIGASVAGPRRPQDRVDLGALKSVFTDLFAQPSPKGYGKPPAELGMRVPIGGANGGAVASGGGKQEAHPKEMPDTPSEREMITNRPSPDRVAIGDIAKAVAGETIGHGSVVIAAITSCTNTSNPSVMLGAGLLARNAAARGLRVDPTVKTSLAPGSRVVSDYLQKTGLQQAFDRLGFHLVGYGCTTCIGNSGPLDPAIEKVIGDKDLVVASVLSGNRNFEARVHQSVKANFLMSPPLVVAYALAGRIDIDLTREPLGQDDAGRDVFLRDIWPDPAELAKLLAETQDPETYRRLYAGVEAGGGAWGAIPIPTGADYRWDPTSTYVREPPYFEGFSLDTTPSTPIRDARALAIFGDSITTDHISPAGSIKTTSPAGGYLQEHGVKVADFNSYGARRGNHEVMVRGTFANVRIKNQMVPGSEGGVTIHQPSGEKTSIYDAAIRYRADGVPLVVFAGKEYGTGSSRDWAAKGTRLLGVRAVVAESFERIHRANLVGMGVLPCELTGDVTVKSLGLDGSEIFDLPGAEGPITPRRKLELVIKKGSNGGQERRVPVILRVDTPIEVEYLQHGGILPYVLRQILRAQSG